MKHLLIALGMCWWCKRIQKKFKIWALPPRTFAFYSLFSFSSPTHLLSFLQINSKWHQNTEYQENTFKCFVLLFPHILYPIIYTHDPCTQHPKGVSKPAQPLETPLLSSHIRNNITPPWGMSKGTCYLFLSFLQPVWKWSCSVMSDS